MRLRELAGIADNWKMRIRLNLKNEPVEQYLWVDRKLSTVTTYEPEWNVKTLTSPCGKHKLTLNWLNVLLLERPPEWAAPPSFAQRVVEKEFDCTVYEATSTKELSFL
jgi:hypothetical protein